MATTYRAGQVAALLGVSADTVRRWADNGRLETHRTPGGQRLIDGPSLARFLTETAVAPEPEPVVNQSARNRFPGVVTKVEKDRLVALVEIQAGPHRILAFITREAVDQLGLKPGMEAVATVKATSVMVNLPE